MMYLIKPTKTLQGNVRIPGSKSGTARGIILASLAKGESRIYNPIPGIDSYSIIDCCRTLGAKIDCSNDNEWIIEGIGMDLKLSLIHILNDFSRFRIFKYMHYSFLSIIS